MTSTGPTPPEQPPEPAPEPPEPEWQPRPRIRPYLQLPVGPGEAGTDADGSGGPDAVTAPVRPRPFILTAGRVEAVDPEIGLETQVTARPVPPSAPPVGSLASELQAIIRLCAAPMSVAEISARAPLHLGVTRVLVGDLRAAGYLDVHTLDGSQAHDPETILRVIRGLRAIT